MQTESHLFRSNIVFLIIFTILAMLPYASHAQNSEFSYNGRVFSQGIPFTGTGQFKFAIIAVDENNQSEDIVWSNDENYLNEEPVAPIELEVENGIFEIEIGNSNIPNMAAINPSVFKSQSTLYLRKWFNDGVHGFEQLVPDTRFLNPDLLSIYKEDTITLYVNTDTGKDNFNGLDPDHAKKTIQAAIDAIPDRVSSEITINVAPGVYEESVSIVGLNRLSIIGDSTWTLDQRTTCSPNVILQAPYDLESETYSRTGIFMQNNAEINLTGFTIQGFAWNGVELNNGKYNLNRCRITQGGRDGIEGTGNITGKYIEVICDYNNGAGMKINSNSTVYMYRVISDYNGLFGLATNSFTRIYLAGDCSFSHNTTYEGISLAYHSSLQFSGGWNAAWPIFSGNIINNGRYGLSARWNSFSEGHVRAVITGNGTADVYLTPGGNTY